MQEVLATESAVYAVVPQTSGSEPKARRAWVEVDLNAIRANVRAIHAYINRYQTENHPNEVLAVVKADAYGHGLIPVAKAALEAGVRYLGVASVDEGASLREAGIDAPIALLCHFAPDEAEAVLALGLSPTVGDESTLDALILAAQRTGKRSVIHLEIDSGIGRSGILPENAVALWRRAVENEIRVTGLCTHFAAPDAPDDRFTKQQMLRFAQTARELEAAGARFVWIHESSSAAVLRWPGCRGNLVRPGLLLYGLRPAVCPQIELQSALTLKARVATVRELPAGHNISYGLTCALSRPSRVATVLIGYGDGYPRRLSNRGSILLHGQSAPILGRVCMDQIVVDVTDIPDVVPGDIAVCIGKQEGAEITVEAIAAAIETTEHEITTCLTPRLPRLYI